MNKDEILEKARNEKNDEGFDSTRYKLYSRWYRFSTFLILALYIFNKVHRLDSYDIFIFYWGISAIEYYSKYRINENIFDMIKAVGTAIASLYCLVSYIFSVINL